MAETPEVAKEFIGRIRVDKVRTEAFNSLQKEWDLGKGSLVFLFSDESFQQVASLNGTSLLIAVEKMRIDDTYVLAIIDLVPPHYQNDAISLVHRPGYVYSPMTGNYYKRERKPESPRKEETVVECLIGDYGLDVRKNDMSEESLRFYGQTRMFAEQSGRCGKNQ